MSEAIEWAQVGSEERVRRGFRMQGMMRTLAAELHRVAPGEVEIRMPVRPEISQQHDFAHAGAVTSILDSACGFAAYSLMPPDAHVLTVDLTVHLLRPAAGEEVRARARVERAGRRITVARAEAYAVRDGAERLCALMTGTMACLLPEDAGQPDGGTTDDRDSAAGAGTLGG